MADYALEKLGPFDIPGIGPRHVRVLAPPRRLPAHLPALVMFDGQNVFDDAPSYAGGWRLHEAIERFSNRRKRAPIVLAIEHGGAARIEELAPWPSPRGGGRLDALLDWVIGALLPLAHHRFGAAHGPEHTAIGGSSMGGLAALYAHFRRPEAFGGALAMSPSLWFGGGKLLDLVASTSRPWTSRIYLDAGEKEGMMLAHARRLADHLRHAKGYDERALRFRVDKRGRHRELDWRRRAPAALRFLFRLDRTSDRAPLAA